MFQTTLKHSENYNMYYEKLTLVSINNFSPWFYFRPNEARANVVEIQLFTCQVIHSYSRTSRYAKR